MRIFLALTSEQLSSGFILAALVNLVLEVGITIALSIILVRFVRQQSAHFHNSKSELERVKYLLLICGGIIVAAGALAFASYILVILSHAFTNPNGEL